MLVYYEVFILDLQSHMRSAVGKRGERTQGPGFSCCSPLLGAAPRRGRALERESEALSQIRCVRGGLVGEECLLEERREGKSGGKGSWGDARRRWRKKDSESRVARESSCARGVRTRVGSLAISDEVRKSVGYSSRQTGDLDHIHVVNVVALLMITRVEGRARCNGRGGGTAGRRGRWQGEGPKGA